MARRMLRNYEPYFLKWKTAPNYPWSEGLWVPVFMKLTIFIWQLRLLDSGIAEEILQKNDVDLPYAPEKPHSRMFLDLADEDDWF